MVLDFGALKDLMVEKVHDVLDHSFIVYAEDYELLGSFGMYYEREDESGGHYGPGSENNYNWKVVVLPYVPTAENLARWIFEQLEDEFKGYTRLSGVSVWETPNCIATYNGSMMFDAAKIAREVYDHEKEDDETTEGGEAGSEVADHSDGEQVQDAVEAVQDEASAEVRLDRPSPWSSKLFNS
jgi:6-pyruvoyl-tetrahydropterin synthase